MMKKYGFELEGRVLYNHGGIVIATNSKTIDEHDLLIREKHVYLARGILEKLSGSAREPFISSMDALTEYNWRDYLKSAKIGISELRLAFAQARIKELEGKLECLILEQMESEKAKDYL